MKVKNFITFLFLICLFLPTTNAQETKKAYHYIENTKLEELPPKLRSTVHRAMTELIVRFDAKEKMPPYFKSRHSHFRVRDFIKSVTGHLIETCHADNQNTCFFGGWPSVRSGSCGVPWSSAAKGKAESLGTSSYDSSKYCGDDNLFRCNPLIFGPGLDQSLVGDSLPRVNGRKNNDSPYSAGICVEVNGTYNGLSKRCHEASLKLDELRVANGEKPWREGNFFNKDNADDFKNLQLQMAQKCREQREKLNADKMCESLESSLALTASAVEAQKIADLNVTELFPQCNDIQPEPPKCNDGLNSGYNSLAQALEELQNKSGCSFSGIQAMESDLMGHLMDNPTYQCPGHVTVANKGTFREGTQSIQFFGKDKALLGRLEIDLKEDMTKEDILKAITFNQGNHTNAFKKMCNESICPRSSQESLKKLYDSMNNMKTRKTCPGIGSIIAVDFDSANNELYRAKECPMAVDGKLESEGLSEEDEKVSLILRDKEGNYLLTVTRDINTKMSQAMIQSSFEDGEYIELCQKLAMDNRVDPESAKEDLGIDSNEFMPPTWEKNNLLARLRNIGGLLIELNEDGSLKVKAKDEIDLKSKFADINRELVTSAHINNGSSLLEISGDTITIKAPDSVAIEIMANKSDVTLGDKETKSLVLLSQEGLPATQVGRSKKVGDLIVMGAYPQGDFPLTEGMEINEGLFVNNLTTNCPPDKAVCNYVFNMGSTRTIASENVNDGPMVDDSDSPSPTPPVLEDGASGPQ